MSSGRPKYCDTCKEPAAKLGPLGPKVVELCGKIWHRKCFKCWQCCKPLDPKSCRFRVENPSCEMCATNSRKLTDTADTEPYSSWPDYSEYLEIVPDEISPDDGTYQKINEFQQTSRAKSDISRDVISEHRDIVVKSADPHDVLLNYIVDHLFSKRCIQEDQMQLVKSGQIPRTRIGKLLDFVASEGYETLIEFCNALDNFGTEDKKQLADTLRQSIGEKDASNSRAPAYNYQGLSNTADVRPAMTRIQEWTRPETVQRTSSNADDYKYVDTYDLYNKELIYCNSLRTFTDVELNSGLYRWKFLNIEPVVASSQRDNVIQEALSAIQVGYSIDPFDFPNIPEGYSLLHNAVIHCLPHERVFDNPVLIAIHLPIQLLSATGASRIAIYYSPTDLKETPHWRPFIKKTTDTSGNVHFNEEAMEGERSNAAVTCIEKAEVVLTLHRFCMFAVAIDGPYEDMIKTSVVVYVKLRVCDIAYNVDVLVLIGCDKEVMASEEQFVLTQNEYRKVESQHFHTVNSGGDMIIKMSHDDIRWMEDATITDEQQFVQHKIDILHGVTKSKFTVSSLKAVEIGVVNYCMFNVNILQLGRRPVVVKVSKDLHQLLSVGVVLPHCRCSTCTHHQTSPESVPVYDQPSTTPALPVVAEAGYVNLEPPPLPPRSQREVQYTTGPINSPRRVRGSMKLYSTIAKKQ